MPTPAPITIGSHVSPLGTIIATTVKPATHVHGHDYVANQTLRSGERYEVASLSDHFAILVHPDHPDGQQYTVQLHEIEPW